MDQRGSITFVTSGGTLQKSLPFTKVTRSESPASPQHNDILIKRVFLYPFGISCVFFEIFPEYFVTLLRARGSSEVCTPLPQLHLQGQGSPAGPLPAGPVPGHGGRHGAGGGALPGVHRVGQGREEDLPQTGAGGEARRRRGACSHKQFCSASGAHSLSGGSR